MQNQTEDFNKIEKKTDRAVSLILSLSLSGTSARLFFFSTSLNAHQTLIWGSLCAKRLQRNRVRRRNSRLLLSRAHRERVNCARAYLENSP